MGLSSADMEPPYDGGCLCGAVRYSFSAPAVGARICHCRACQKAMGAPYLAQASFPRASLNVTGETARFRSSARLWRHFCRICGTRLFIEPIDAPDRIGVPIATLDDPRAVRPDRHIWVSAKLDWVRIDDGLPQDDEASTVPYRDI